MSVFVTGTSWRLFQSLAVGPPPLEAPTVASQWGPAGAHAIALAQLVWASLVPLLLMLPLVHPVSLWLHLPVQAFAVGRVLQHNKFVWFKTQTLSMGMPPRPTWQGGCMSCWGGPLPSSPRDRWQCPGLTGRKRSCASQSWPCCSYSWALGCLRRFKLWLKPEGSSGTHSLRGSLLQEIHPRGVRQ